MCSTESASLELSVIRNISCTENEDTDNLLFDSIHKGISETCNGTELKFRELQKLAGRTKLMHRKLKGKGTREEFGKFCQLRAKPTTSEMVGTVMY